MRRPNSTRLWTSGFRPWPKSRAHSLKPVSIALAVAIAALAPVSAQVRYASGQNVVPVFEGWERNADGSFNMVFGYMNRNYEERLDIPIGPDNTLEPGGADQGQPTHFYPRRQQFVFKVRVPKDWGKKDLVWTLKSSGKTEKAYASLLPFWELGLFVYEENRGSTAVITDKPHPNEAPSIRLPTPGPMSARVGETISLITEVTDDGNPPPRPAPVRRDADGAVITQTGTPGPGATGPRRESPLTQALVRLEPGVSLGVTWVVYRGSSDGVTFAPQRVAVVNGTTTSTVSFAKPGSYVLRAYADDGVLLTPADVTVNVR